MTSNETILRLLIERDPHEAREHSFKNFHVEGLGYLNLLRTRELTIKLYFSPPQGIVLLNKTARGERGQLVHPHDHSYDFEQRVLAGGVFHEMYEVGSSGDLTDPRPAFDCTTFAFDGAYRMARGMVRRGASARLVRIGTVPLGVGGMVTMRAEEVHTIHTHKEEHTILITWQHRSRRERTHLYVADRSLSEGLEDELRNPKACMYEKPSLAEVAEWRDRARIAIEVAAQVGAREAKIRG